MSAGTQAPQPLNFTLASDHPSLNQPLLISQPIQNEQLKNTPNESIKRFIETDLLKILSSIAFPALSSGATCVGDTVADLSWLLRTLMPEAPSTEWVGLTTGENVIRGAWAAIKAWKRFKDAYAIGDKGGMIESGIDVPRGIFQSAGGACYLAYRGLMVAADVKNLNTAFNAATPLGKAAFAVGTAGNVLFNIFYIAISAWAGYEYHEVRKFREGLDACGTEEELLNFFEKKSIANPMAKLNGSEEPAEAVKGNYAAIALEAISDLLYAQMESLEVEGDEKPPSKEEIKELVGGLFQIQGNALKNSETYKTLISSMGLKPEQIAEYDFSFLELLGFKLEEMKHQSRKDAKLARVGAGAQIKKALERGLGPRLASENPLVKEAALEEIHALKGKVETANTTNKIVLGLVLAVGILGIVSSIIGFFPVLTAVSGTLLIVVTLVLCLGMLGTDAYFMYNGWGSGMPGRYDKHYIAALAGMIVVILGVAIASTLSFGLPVFPLIFTGVFAAVGLGLCGIAFDEVHYKEKKWIWEHPDLKAFLNTLNLSLASDDEALDEKTALQFKKLPKADKRAIKQKYIEMSKDLPLLTPKYRELDKNFDFGGEYFYSQITPDGLNNEKEHALLLRGIRKTLSFYWQKWAIEKTEESKRIALEMQALFEAVSKKNAEAIKAAVAKMGDQAYYATLKQNLWYVVKRQESKKNLAHIVASVELDQQAALSADQQTPSLSDYLWDIHKSA